MLGIGRALYLATHAISHDRADVDDYWSAHGPAIVDAVGHDIVFAEHQCSTNNEPHHDRADYEN
jgi:hypothetical protein